MAQVSQTWLEAEAMVEEFKNAFGKKFGVPVVITYKLSNRKGLPQVSLDDLYTVVNDMFNKDNAVLTRKNTHKPVDLSKGIFSKTRVREVVVMRQIFFYIATELGYGPSHVERFTDNRFDHASVIHGKKTIANLLETGNNNVNQIYKNVKIEMCNKFEEFRSYEKNKERDTERSIE